MGRFWSKVSAGSSLECWLWKASVDRGGYGKICAGGEGNGWRKAHRVSWELHNGPIPDGLHVLHRCDNPPCVNPAHLFLGTHLENNADKIRKGRQQRGERHGIAKLTDADARDIRQSHSRGESAGSIARRLGVCHSTVDDVVRGATWTHPEAYPEAESFAGIAAAAANARQPSLFATRST